MAKIENPKNFNAGSRMMNSRIPSADQKRKKMDTNDSSSSSLKDKNKGTSLKDKSLDSLKREAKKQIISTAASVVSDGAVNKDAVKKALDTKLGTMAVDSISTPGEKYRRNINKKREERAQNGQDPDSAIVYLEALPLSAKALVFGGVGLFFGIIIFISTFVTLYNDQTMKTKQVVGHMSAYVVESSAPIGWNTALGEYGNGIFDGLFDKLKARFSFEAAKLYENLGNIFSLNNKCLDEECEQTEEYLYFQKISDISYRYKNLYNISLDWPLIIATNQITVQDTIKSFEENLNTYNLDDVSNLNIVTNLDWEYDYENIDGYVYLATDDSRYDLQILAKNMVKKTSVQECVLNNKVMQTKTVYDVLDSDLVEGNENYLKCTTGTYKVTNKYELDYEKYDEFILEYLENKKYGASSDYNGSPNPVTIEGGRDFASSMINVARSQLGTTEKSKFWEYMGFSSRVAWCASFVSWVNANTSFEGKTLYPNIIKTKNAQSQAFMKYFKNSSDANIQFHYNTNCDKYRQYEGTYIPKQGDLVFFDWQSQWSGNFLDLESKKYVDHIGIVSAYQNGTLYTIEGNSSDNVRERHYNLTGSNSCQVVGFGSWY